MGGGGNNTSFVIIFTEKICIPSIILRYDPWVNLTVLIVQEWCTIQGNSWWIYELIPVYVFVAVKPVCWSGKVNEQQFRAAKPIAKRSP